MIKKWVPFWAVAATVLMAIGTVWLRLTIVGTTYSINQTERMLQNMRKDRERVQLKLVGLRSPRRLEALAKSRYGLKIPSPDQIVRIK